MEDSTIPELLAEVTAIEDLVHSSRPDNQEARALRITARGFRNLVDRPQDYGADHAAFERWITKPETTFGEAEKSAKEDAKAKKDRRKSDSPARMVHALYKALLSSEDLNAGNRDNAQPYEQLGHTFELTEVQQQAFIDAEEDQKGLSR